MRASFEVPKAQCQVLGVENDHSAPPAPKCFKKDQFLPLPDPQMGSQDYLLLQPKKTLVYAKVLQYWVKEAEPPNPGEPCHLVESVLELWWAIEPLTTFSDSEVLDDATSPRLAGPTPHEHSLSCTCQACPRGSFAVTCGGG